MGRGRETRHIFRLRKQKTHEVGRRRRKKLEIDVESGRLRESLSVSAYRSHADDDDESLVKLLT